MNRQIYPQEPGRGSFQGWSVQFVMPVNNPVDNVRKVKVDGGYLFEVPINYPDMHLLTLMQLFEAAERSANINVVPSP